MIVYPFWWPLYYFQKTLVNWKNRSDYSYLDDIHLQANWWPEWIGQLLIRPNMAKLTGTLNITTGNQHHTVTYNFQKWELCSHAFKNALFQHFSFISDHLAMLKITTPSSKLEYLATNHRVVEILIANGQSSVSIIKVTQNRYLKVISWISNLYMSSNMTLGKIPPCLWWYWLIHLLKGLKLVMNTQFTLGRLLQATPLKDFIQSRFQKEIMIIYYCFYCSLLSQKLMSLENMLEIHPAIFPSFCRNREFLWKLQKASTSILFHAWVLVWAAHGKLSGTFF